MEDQVELREAVRQRYAAAALTVLESGSASCCGPAGCCGGSNDPVSSEPGPGHTARSSTLSGQPPRTWPEPTSGLAAPLALGGFQLVKHPWSHARSE
jgi:hypothetical protein